MSSMQISQVLAEMRALQARASGISQAPAPGAQPSDFANLMKNSIDSVANMQNQATALADASTTSAYRGLAPAWHLSLATVTRVDGGLWTLSGWQPEN